MENEFWLDKWKLNQIHFHRDQPHPTLVKFLPQMTFEGQKNVLVPLCGKSLDMTYLIKNDFSVVGFELSPLAISQYFEEHQLTPTLSQLSEFEVKSVDDLHLCCGDFFKLSKTDLESLNGSINFIYDRAALIAMPIELRKKYYEQINNLTNSKTKWLLIVLEYDQNKIQGPPFSIGREELDKYLSSQFKIELLEESTTNSLGKKFEEVGMNKVIEKCYLLIKK